MTNHNILVIANCVSFSLVQMIKSLRNNNITARGIECYWKFDEGLETLNTYPFDVLLTTEIFDTNNPFYTPKLKEQYPDKLIMTFPSLRYHGENPWVTYTDSVPAGPWGPYHDMRIYDNWLNKVKPSDVTMYYDLEVVARCHENNIAELRRRETEKQMDFKLSELVSKLTSTSTKPKLFSAFNHPTHTVLKPLLFQLFDMLGLDQPISAHANRSEIFPKITNIYDTVDTVYDMTDNGVSVHDATLYDIVKAFYKHYNTLDTEHHQCMSKERDQLNSFWLQSPAHG